MTAVPPDPLPGPPGASRVLLRGGLVHTGETGHRHTALAMADGRVVGTGDETWASGYDSADEVVDLDGALVTPAFVDAHVHTVATGFLRTQLDLTACRGLAECLDAVAARHASEAAPGGDLRDTVLVGTGWDESRWREGRPPTAEELERAAPGRRVHLARVDGHSAVVSHAFAEAVPGLVGLVGWQPTGRVEREAFAATNRTLGLLVGQAQRLAAARAAVADMAGLGIAAFHENAAPHLGPVTELSLVRRAAEERGLHATLYWGERGAFDVLEAYGAVGLAGDLNADGAIGSCTAAMTAPYSETPAHGGGHGAHATEHRGHEFLDVAEVADHLVACTTAGVQGGFHCIGDAALEVVAAGLEAAAGRLGDDRVRAARHRLEHVEMPSAGVRRTLARLGVTASVQPVFDALWGGPTGMYATRLGERWQEMNPFAALAADGVPIAFGSDGPVTALGGWQAVRAAVAHRTPAHALAPVPAFRAHTVGGWRAARVDDAGSLAPGQRADVAVWDVRPGPGTDSAWLPRYVTTPARPEGEGEDAAVGEVGSPDPGVAPRCVRLWSSGAAVDLGEPPRS